MEQVALVIGNGFDLDLGFFVSSPREFTKCVLEHGFFEGHYYDENTSEHSLVCHLRRYIEKWSETEEIIHDLVASNIGCTNQTRNQLRDELKILKTTLADFHQKNLMIFSANKYSLAYELVEEMIESPIEVNCFSFNYTDTKRMIGILDGWAETFATFTHVHGSYKHKDIIWGCSLKKGEEPNRDLCFLYKVNQMKQANHIVKHLLNAKEVIIFGHSMNEMDFCYFREYFKAASSCPLPARHLTIITDDEESEVDIKYNLTVQGISLQDLYNNLESFTFIHTKNYYKDNEEECNKFEDLQYRLRCAYKDEEEENEVEETEPSEDIDN